MSPSPHLNLGLLILKATPCTYRLIGGSQHLIMPGLLYMLWINYGVDSYKYAHFADEAWQGFLSP